MPSLTVPDLPKWNPSPLTQELLEYANLSVIDLAQATTPEGRRGLAPKLRDAMTSTGFFYTINHGYTQAQNDRMFDIANFTFDGVTSEDKVAYAGKDSHTYEGYKPRETWRIEPGVKDQIEHYNVNHEVDKREHPKPLRPLLPEIKDFIELNHRRVAHTILRLLAIGLELPEDALVNTHPMDKPGESSLRFMKYYPRTQEEEKQAKNVWLKGHTDDGGVSVLWSQRIAALQILSKDGKWRWIKHIENALVINIGDALEFLSGGYYKATIHRVVQPPFDQRNTPRVGVFYFCKPNDALQLVPFAQSPVLQRVGITRQCEDEVAPTMEQWRKGRTSTYGYTEPKKRDDGHEEEIVAGIVVKHYN